MLGEILEAAVLLETALSSTLSLLCFGTITRMERWPSGLWRRLAPAPFARERRGTATFLKRMIDLSYVVFLCITKP